MPNSDPLARKNTVFKGYAAFNERDWDALKEVLCEDVVWHPMDGGAAIRGRDGVISYLQELGEPEVDLMGMAIQGDAAITVDVTRMTGEFGEHACADKIVFDDSGCIREVWHCASATHEHGHAGHPVGHSH